MTKIVYKFHGHDFYCDENGKFFNKEDKPLKIIYNNGSRSLLFEKKKFGLIKLRKIAFKSKIEIIDCPF